MPIAKADPITGEATSSGKGLLKMKGVSDPNPLSINLVNYPKTKDFSNEQESQIVEDIAIKPEVDLKPEKPKTKLSDTITSLENSFNLEPTQMSSSPEVKELSEAALLVLNFFDNAKIKNAKSIRELKDANKLRQLDSSMLLMALRELVVKELLTFDAEGRYLKPDWQ